MLDTKDAQWWILEAQQHPDQATHLIRQLADRLAFLDRQNEELRGELIEFKRKARGIATNTGSAELTSLQKRVQELEGALRQLGGNRQVLAYDGNRLLAIGGYEALQAGTITAVSPQTRLLIGTPGAHLFTITADSRVYPVALSDLPVPSEAPITLEAPREIAAFLDQAAFENCRYLILVSRAGFAYSLLAGTLNRAAQKGEKMIRNLIPGDPIVAAYPSNNADLFALTRRGRWLRFPEKAISGTGSQLIDLPKNDSLVGLIWLSNETPLYFVSSDGRLFARLSSDLPARRTVGKSAGVLFPDREMIGLGLGAELTVLTSEGHLLNVLLAGLPARAEGENGMQLEGLNAGETILTTHFA